MAGHEANFWNRLDAIASADSAANLHAAVMDCARLHGFEAAYFLAPVTADPRVERNLINVGFPQQWERVYRASSHLADPLPAIAMDRSSAFRWSDARTLADLTPAAILYLDRLELSGWGEGIAIPCFGPNARFAFLGLGMPREDASLTDKTLRMMQVVGQAAFQRQCEIDPVTREASPNLSRRELEVIRWIGEGKSNAVIAAILDISKSSVDIYVKRIFAKLDVHDRTTASLRALAMGLIAPSDPRTDHCEDQPAKPHQPSKSSAAKVPASSD